MNFPLVNFKNNEMIKPLDSIAQIQQTSIITNGNQTTSEETKENLIKQTNLLDKFETQVRNSADLNDTIKVPRTIFKGYLSFMLGSGLLTLANLSKKVKPLSIPLTVASTALMAFGTYSFVKPYILKDSPSKG